MIPALQIADVRRRWLAGLHVGGATNGHTNDNQFNVVGRLIELKLNVLAFDMGVWGPYAARREGHFSLLIISTRAANTRTERFQAPSASTTGRQDDNSQLHVLS